MIDRPLFEPLNIETLLLTKQLEPLPPEHLATLKHIESYDVAGFNEAEIRSNIIDPIIRILGYDKGTVFSSDLEHPIYFLGQKRIPDYQLNLWKENFWLLEAKRPRIGEDSFGYDDFKQALEYSVHPSINAPLIVLCDGLKIEIFDREVDVNTPVLRLKIAALSSEFDKIRTLLEPIQIWFFQKRRIIRLLDRVFDKEFNLNRVEEFSTLLESRLQSKRNIILENFRAAPKGGGPDEDRRLASSASLEELSEMYLFYEWSIPVTNAVNLRLVELATPASFHVLFKLFPDNPRPVNDAFMAQALTFLIALEEKEPRVNWLPAWLARGRQSDADLSAAIHFLLEQCLTYFEDYEPYRLILLAANAIRRVFKIMVISNNSMQTLGQELHALARHVLPEISWAQILASPENQLIHLIDVQTLNGIRRFVTRYFGDQQHYKLESAKLELRALWMFEKGLLESIGNYPQLLKERPLGEMRMIEWSSVTYDYLGHLTLCLLHRFPKWKEYLLKDHRSFVESMAATGSSQAKEWLGLKAIDSYPPLSDAVLAKRFFLGDEAMLIALRAGYSAAT